MIPDQTAPLGAVRSGSILLYTCKLPKYLSRKDGKSYGLIPKLLFL